MLSRITKILLALGSVALPNLGQVVTNSNFEGPGSLAEAIATASSGAIITFAAALSGGDFACPATIFNKNIAIDASFLAKPPKLYPSSPTGQFEVNSGFRLDLTNLELYFPIVNRGTFRGDRLAMVATRAGAAITNAQNATVQLSSSTFRMFETDIFNQGGSLTIFNCSLNWIISQGGSISSVGSKAFSLTSRDGDFFLSNMELSSLKIESGSFHGDRILVDGGPLWEGRGVTIELGATAHLANSTITRSEFSGIINRGVLTMANCTVSANLKSGIQNLATGVARINDTFVERNTIDDASFLKLGAGIHNLGSLTLLRGSTSFNGNYGSGGGIWNGPGAALSLTNTTIKSNESRYGAGIYNEGSIDGQGVTLEGNHGVNPLAFDDGEGGAIYSPQGNIRLTDCRILGNQARSSGGISKSAGDLTLNRTVVAFNLSQRRSNGGDCQGGTGASITSGAGRVKIVDSTISSNQTAGVFCRSPDNAVFNVEGGAGGVAVNGDLEVLRSTISHNLGNGIAHSGGILTVVQSTIVSNRELGQFNDSAFVTSGGRGGGILSSGTLRITNSTIASNFVSAPYITESHAKGGGIYFSGSQFSLQNSIVAGNSADTFPDIFGAFTGDHNLVGGDPLLGPLANNGGPTQTMLPLPGSPAINSAAYAAFATDQRGFPALVSLFPDIGSVESAQLKPLSFTAQFSPSGAFEIAFTAAPGIPLNVLTSTNPTLPLTSWGLISRAIESPPNTGQFTISFTPPDQPAPARFFAIVPARP